MRLVTLLLPFLVNACSTTACEDVNTAYLACVDELIAATGNPEAAIDEPIFDCSLYADADQAFFTCKAEAWTNGDCTTAAGLGVATAAFNACEP